MFRSPRTIFSRLLALTNTLCVVAMLLVGFSSAEAKVQVLEHRIAGHEFLSDGGWAAPCADTKGACNGHMKGSEPMSTDLLDVHHHHHANAEVTHGLIIDQASENLNLSLADIAFQPAEALPLAGRDPALPYQPPRA